MNTAKMRKRNEQCTIEQGHGSAKPFLILTFAFLISHFSFHICNAQNFTQRIQQPVAGQGTVTINQSAEIDQLVNSATLSTGKTATTTKNNATSQTKTAANTVATGHGAATEQATAGNPENQDEVMPTRTTKVTGYRVQVYAGYNREGKLTAERTRNSLKSQYPNVPVYVNFFNPRWVCRMGNYRSYEEAHQMLTSLKNQGYKECTIVKGKIVVHN